MEQMQSFRYLLEIAMPVKALAAWTPHIVEGRPGINFKTKYFSTGRDAAACENVPFHPLVDPAGILHDLLSSNVRHGLENEVIYKKLVTDEEDNTRT